MKDWQAYLTIAAVIALVIFALIAWSHDNDAKQECIQRGGIIHEYGCHANNGTSYGCRWQCVEGGR